MKYKELTQNISGSLKTLAQDSPDLMKSFNQLSQVAMRDGVIDPKTKEEVATRKRYAKSLWQLRQRRGVTELDAEKWMRERNYFALMMVNEGEADAMVTGYSRSYPSVVKPVMELIDKQHGVSRIATTNLMMTSRGPLFLSDTAINPNPSAEDLAKIALMTAKTVRLFGMEPIGYKKETAY